MLDSASSWLDLCARPLAHQFSAYDFLCRPGRQRLRRSRSRDGGRDRRGRSSSREDDVEDGERRPPPVPAPAHDATGVQLEHFQGRQFGSCTSQRPAVAQVWAVFLLWRASPTCQKAVPAKLSLQGSLCSESTPHRQPLHGAVTMTCLLSLRRS